MKKAPVLVAAAAFGLFSFVPFTTVAADSHDGAATTSELDANTAEAKEAAMALGKTLKSELQAAMKAGGPVNALDVCNTKAKKLTDATAAAKGVEIGRVSLKNRNPGNAAEGWKKDVLEMFEEYKAGGATPDKYVYREIVEENGAREFRFMKAILTAEVCLNCHGTELKEDVAAKINTLYPEDKATGFNIGDIRGAFWIVKKL